MQDYEDDRLGFLLRTRGEFGDVVASDARTTIVNSGALAREILLDRRRDFIVQENFLQETISVEASQETAELRRLLSPGLREVACSDLLPGLIRRIDAEVATWISSGLAVDPVPIVERAIASSVAEYYFAVDGDRLAPMLTDLLNALSRTILDPLVLPWRSVSPARRESRRRYLLVEREVTRLLEQRLRAGRSEDFAASIVLADGSRTPVPRLTQLIVGSMLAAQRVPAAAAAWTLMHVEDAPQWQPALREEAARLDAARHRSLGSIRASDFPMATSCVLESLRLEPATWLITRRSANDVELGGYRFKAGHHFMISPYVIHRDDREFPSSTRFLPERWLETPTPTGTYLPFGHGQHVCPGRHLAVLALTVVLLRVVQVGQCRDVGGGVTANPRNTLIPDGLRVMCNRWETPTPKPSLGPDAWPAAG
jgi:unspecific monooxygenase